MGATHRGELAPRSDVGGDTSGRFATPGDVIVALRRARDFYDPRSCSMLLVGKARTVNTEPFRSGFLATFEERTELMRALGRIDERARRLLLLWYVEGVPVAHIARRLEISRVHCYRLRNQTLEAIVRMSRAPADAEDASPEPETILRTAWAR